MGIMDMAVVVETDGETEEEQIRIWKAHRSAASNRKEFYGIFYEPASGVALEHGIKQAGIENDA